MREVGDQVVPHLVVPGDGGVGQRDQGLERRTLDRPVRRADVSASTTSRWHHPTRCLIVGGD